MPTLRTETTRRGPVTLVELSLRTDESATVELAVEAPGPIWPPGDTGPRVTWSASGATVRTDGDAVPLGFATPAVPAAVDVDVAAVEPRDSLPGSVENWIVRVEERVATAERFDDVEDLASATRAVRAAGGLAGVESLAGRLERDRRVLSRLGVASEALHDRGWTTSLQASTLGRIAHSRRSW